MPHAFAAALAGLGLGLSLIVAIGAQNAFVLRQGLRREHVLIVVVVCAASDAILITAGVAGLGVLIQQAGWILVVVRIAGAAFRAWYGIGAARRAIKPKVLEADEGGDRMTRAAAITTVLALTWLNPHVYLDTVLMLGSIAATHGDERWLFAAGAMAASLLWFTALGFGARLLAPVFAKAAAWVWLELGVGLTMWAIAAALAFG